MYVEAGAVGVCHGPRCSDSGGRVLAETLEAHGVICEPLACQSLCTYAPTARVHGIAVLHATAERIALRLQE